MHAGLGASEMQRRAGGAANFVEQDVRDTCHAFVAGPVAGKFKKAGDTRTEQWRDLDDAAVSSSNWGRSRFDVQRAKADASGHLNTVRNARRNPNGAFRGHDPGAMVCLYRHDPFGCVDELGHIVSVRNDGETGLMLLREPLERRLEGDRDHRNRLAGFRHYLSLYG